MKNKLLLLILLLNLNLHKFHHQHKKLNNLRKQLHLQQIQLLFFYSSFGFTELIKKIGVERRVHTAGKNKSTLDPFLDEKNEDIERLKKIQLDLHKDFIDVVEESRGSKLNKSEIELFSGEFWSGSKAKDLGLIDGIGNAHEILKEKFGDDVVIKKFEKSKGWLSQKISSSSNQVDQLANILDERSIWQRYGF